MKTATKKRRRVVRREVQASDGGRMPQRVSWRNKSDLTAAMMAACGWPASIIAEETGLSQSQAVYRYRKANIKIRDYRKMEAGTLGGKVAKATLTQQLKQHRGLIQNHLPTLDNGKRKRRDIELQGGVEGIGD